MNSQQGFTLIELMIVVAIVGILALVAMPMYKDYVHKAADSACLAEARGYAGAQLIASTQGEIMDEFKWSACEPLDNTNNDADTVAVAPNFQTQSAKPGKYQIQCVETGSCSLLNKEGEVVEWEKPLSDPI